MQRAQSIAMDTLKRYEEDWQDYIESEARMGTTELSASEAVYGFAAWLTTRYEPVTLSALHDAGIAAELVAEFCKVNGLPEPRDHWEQNLTHPTSGVSGAVALYAIAQNL